VGAKNALLAFGDIGTALRSAKPADQAEAEALVRRSYPHRAVEAIGAKDLFSAMNPPDRTVYAAVFPEAELLCDWTIVADQPSDVPLLELGAGRRTVLHAMHSAADALVFGLWEDGQVVRFLSVSPEDGIVTNIGEPLDFEVPYWAGEHSVDTGGWPDAEPYPLPFHPMQLGEEALRALFDFVNEGAPQPDDVDTLAVPVHGFRV
jgi:hypothetical protein